MDRGAFERLVRNTAYRPVTAEAVLGELAFQTLFYRNPNQDGLEELAEGLVPAFSGRLPEARNRLSHLAREHHEQPLCHYYLFAVHCQSEDLAAAVESLARVTELHPEDPVVDILRTHFEGKTTPQTSDDVRLAYIRKFAGTAILRNAYQLAVAAVFETIRDTDHARVLDIGIGGGAQMSELLSLLERREHRVRRLDVLGVDFVDAFLKTAADAISARARELAPRVMVSFHPVKAQIERLTPSTAREIVEDGPLDAVNATITLHEVPGERKISALQNLRALSPRRVVLVEWNSFLENTLPETSVEFFYNIRRIATAWTVGLRERYPLAEVYEIIRAALAQGQGQVTCPASQRQECYLDAGCWKALLEATGFRTENPRPALLQYTDRPDRAGLGSAPWYLAAYRDQGTTPIVLLEATPHEAGAPCDRSIWRERRDLNPRSPA